MPSNQFTRVLLNKKRIKMSGELMPRLTNAECEGAVGRLHAGQSVAAVPRQLRQETQITLRHLRNRLETAGSTSRQLLRGRVSQSTIRNRVRTAGLRARRPYTGPTFTPFHRRQRLERTRRHVRWNQRRWNSVFSHMTSRVNTQ